MQSQIVAVIFVLLVFITAGIIFSKKLNQINDILERVAHGDLTKKFIKPIGVFKNLYLNMNELILSMRRFINETTILTDKLIVHFEKLQESGHQVQNLTESANKRIGYIASSMNKQASCMHETQDLVNYMIKEHQEIVENGRLIEIMSLSMNEKVKGTNEVYEKLVYKLDQSAEANKLLSQKGIQLSDKTSKIQTIVDTVNQISDNTKLLAFNASIEAARAGENGAGFSVIAQEIQKLADLSSAQSKEIQSMITDIKEGINDIAASMAIEAETINSTISFSGAAKEHLEEITRANQEVLKAVESINAVISTQSEKVNEIEQIVADVNHIAQEINADTETMTVAAQEQLATVINVFDTVSNLTELNKGLKYSIDAFIKNYVVNEQTKAYIEEGLQSLIELSKDKTLWTMEWYACTKLLKEKVAENPYFELFGLIDKNGIRRAITLDYSEEKVLKSFGHRTYFKEAIKGRNYESKPYISVDTNNYCIAVAVPIRNEEGKEAGVLMGDLILG